MKVTRMEGLFDSSNSSSDGPILRSVSFESPLFSSVEDSDDGKKLIQREMERGIDEYVARSESEKDSEDSMSNTQQKKREKEEKREKAHIPRYNIRSIACRIRIYEVAPSTTTRAVKDRKIFQVCYSRDTSLTTNILPRIKIGKKSRKVYRA